MYFLVNASPKRLDVATSHFAEALISSKAGIFSQTIVSVELKFYVKTPYDNLAKIYTKYFGHMTKMVATPYTVETF